MIVVFIVKYFHNKVITETVIIDKLIFQLTLSFYFKDMFGIRWQVAYPQAEIPENSKISNISIDFVFYSLL